MELIIGRWYRVIGYGNCYYKFGGWLDKNKKIELLKYYDREFRNILSATNNDFWENAKLATVEELSSFLEPGNPDLLIFNCYELW